MEAILAFARSAMNYTPDPAMRQTCYRPRYMLCAQGAKLCVKIGNCVNMNCALGALLRAAGFDVKVQGIEYGGGAQDHVNILVKLVDERSKWAEADATTNAPVGNVSPGRKLVYDPLNPAVTGAGVAGGAFIGAGRPMEIVTTHEAIFGRQIGAGINAVGAHTVHEVVDLANAWDYFVSQQAAAVNCARVAGWAAQYGYGEQDASTQWLDLFGDATATYYAVRVDVDALVAALKAAGGDWDTDGAWLAKGTTSVDVWAEMLAAVAPFTTLDRWLRTQGNPTGFPQQCLPTYPKTPQPTAPDWQLDLYKTLTNLPGMSPSAPWYRPFEIAAYIVAGTVVVAGGVYVATKVVPAFRGASEPKLRRKRRRRKMAA